MTPELALEELKKTYKVVGLYQEGDLWVCHCSVRKDGYFRGQTGNRLRGESPSKLAAILDVLDRTNAINATIHGTEKGPNRYTELMKDEDELLQFTGPFKKAHEGTITVAEGPDGVPEIRLVKEEGTWLINAVVPSNLRGRKVRITVETIDDP